MKKNIQILLVVFLTGMLFVSCEKDKSELKYTGDNFIAFSETGFSVDESKKGMVEIVVFMAAPKQGSAVTVQVDIISPDTSAIDGVHYNLVYPTDGKLTFAAGSFYDTILVEVIDNSDEDGDKTIEMTIATNTAGMTIGYPGPDEIGKTAELVITDNDCEFIKSAFTGSISGVEKVPYYAERTTKAVLEVVDSVTDPTKVVYHMNDIMKSLFEQWGEEIDPVGVGDSKGGTVELTFDYSDPFKPKIILTEGNMCTTNGGAWVYDIYEDSSKESTFFTCGNRIIFYYYMHIRAGGGSATDKEACYIIGEFAE